MKQASSSLCQAGVVAVIALPDRGRLVLFRHVRVRVVVRSWLCSRCHFFMIEVRIWVDGVHFGVVFLIVLINFG